MDKGRILISILEKVGFGSALRKRSYPDPFLVKIGSDFGKRLDPVSISKKSNPVRIRIQSENPYSKSDFSFNIFESRIRIQIFLEGRTRIRKPTV